MGTRICEKLLVNEAARYIVADGNTFDTTTLEGRMAARAYAFAVLAQGDDATFKSIIAVVGREE